MSIRLRALIHTVGFVASAMVIGFATAQILQQIPLAWLPWLGLGFLIVGGGSVVYNITKSQLEYREKLQKMVDQK